MAYFTNALSQFFGSLRYVCDFCARGCGSRATCSCLKKPSLDFVSSFKSDGFRGMGLSERWLRWIPILATYLTMAYGFALFAQDSAREYAAKAASLVLFPDYVKWPVAGRTVITVGILGDDLFGGALVGLNVKRSKRVDDLKDCQVVFVSKSEQENVDAILKSLEGTNILTVGECADFAKLGGIIGLVMVGDAVRFEINTSAARRAGLGIDLRLLKLAFRVINS